MRKIALAFVLCLPLAIGACENQVPILNGQSASQTAPQVFQTAEKSLTVAHIAYDAIGRQILQATQAGLLRGSTAAQVKVVYDKAGDALNVADTADRAGNTTNLLAAIQDANSAIAQTKNLIGVH